MDTQQDTQDTQDRVLISALALISEINIMTMTDGGGDGSGRIYITRNGLYQSPTTWAAMLDLRAWAGDWPIWALRGQAADIAAEWLQDHADLIDGDIWALRD